MEKDNNIATNQPQAQVKSTSQLGLRRSDKRNVNASSEEPKKSPEQGVETSNKSLDENTKTKKTHNPFTGKTTHTTTGTRTQTDENGQSHTINVNETRTQKKGLFGGESTSLERHNTEQKGAGGSIYDNAAPSFGKKNSSQHSENTRDIGDRNNTSAYTSHREAPGFDTQPIGNIESKSKRDRR